MNLAARSPSLSPGVARLWRAGLVWLQRAWEAATIYLPVVLMGVLALVTYWMVQRSPALLEPVAPDPRPSAAHEVDFYMRGAVVRSFDREGRVQSWIVGREIRHYGDDQSVEVDQPQIYWADPQQNITRASARQAKAKEDGSRFELTGQAVVTRQASVTSDGRRMPQQQMRGERLIVDVQAQTIESPLPVEFVSGENRFSADSLRYDHQTRVTELKGRVRVFMAPR